MAIYEIDPWGDAWAQAATIAPAPLAPWSKKKLDPLDFIPGGKRRKRRQSREEVAHRLQLFFDNHNKRET